MSTRRSTEPSDSTQPGNKGGRPALPQDWRQAFLKHVEATGGMYKAAKLAGVPMSWVNRERDRSDDFDDQIRHAKELWADDLSEALTAVGKGTLKGNFLALIAQLRTVRPHLYLDKMQVLSAGVQVNVDATPDEAKSLLRMALGELTPATRLALVGVQQAESGVGLKADTTDTWSAKQTSDPQSPPDTVPDDAPSAVDPK